MKKNLSYASLVLLALAAGTGRGQGPTTIDARTQTRNIDFSNASFTRPFKVGTVLPSTCSLGEAFFKSDATAGFNLYTCTFSNIWTQQGPGSSLPSMSSNTGRVLSTDGFVPQWRAMGGDVSGPPDLLTVTGLQGRSIASTTPSNSQVLRWNLAANQWQPSAESISTVFGRSGAVLAQSGDYFFSQIAGTAGVTQGGTGLSSISAGSLLYAGSSNLIGTLTLGSTLQASAGALSVVPGNLTLSTIGGSLSAAQIGSGTLPVARGGTGATSLNNNAVLTGAGTSAVQSSGCTIDSGGNISCPGTLLVGSNSAIAGETLLYDAAGVNYYSWLAPNAISSTVRYRFPATPPAAGQVMLFSAPSSNISTISFASPVTAASSDLLQNKILDNTNTHSGFTTWNQIATPGSPSAGSLRVYAKTANGLCWINSSGVETCAGTGGGVSSVFGRTGAVAAQSGDYSASQVTSAADVTAANTFSAGARQTFQASSSTAGVRLACAALPSSPGAGDLACDSADGNKIKQWNGSAWLTLGFSGTGLADPGSNGVVVRTGSGSTAARTLSAGSSNITIANGDGTAGNPSIDVGANVQIANVSQTVSGNRTFTGIVDAGGAASTKPAKSGTSLPGTCAVGEVFFKTDATAGQNLYYCTATNTWTQQLNSGSGGGSAPVYTTTTFSSTPTFTVSPSTIQVFTITLTGAVTSSTLATANATAGQDITFNICQDATGSRTFAWPSNVTGAGVVYGNASTCSRQTFRFDGANAIAVTTLTCPGCLPGIVIPGSTSGSTTVVAAAAASGTVTIPAATDTLVGKATTDTLTNKTFDTAGGGNSFSINGVAVTANTGAGAVVRADSPTFTGTPVLNTATATSLNGLTITSSTGTLTVPNGVVLTGPAASGTVATLGNSETFTGNKTFTGNLIASGSARTAPAKAGTVANLPGTCTVGDVYFATNVTAGQNLYYCTATDTWTQQLNSGAGGTGCVPGGSAGQLVTADGAGGCNALADFVFTTHTLAGSASSVLDMSAAATSGFKVPGGYTTGVLHNTTTTGAVAGGLIVNADITNSTIDLTAKVTGLLPTGNIAAAALTRAQCDVLGADNGSALADADLGPQTRQYMFPVAMTLSEITVSADAGTPSIQIRKNHGGTTTNLLSAALATASSGGIACAKTSTSQTCLDGATTSSGSITLSTTAVAAGDWLELTSGTAGGTAKRMTVCWTGTVN